MVSIRIRGAKVGGAGARIRKTHGLRHVLPDARGPSLALVARPHAARVRRRPRGRGRARRAHVPERLPAAPRLLHPEDGAGAAHPPGRRRGAQDLRGRGAGPHARPLRPALRLGGLAAAAAEARRGGRRVLHGLPRGVLRRRAGRGAAGRLRLLRVGGDLQPHDDRAVLVLRERRLPAVGGRAALPPHRDRFDDRRAARVAPRRAALRDGHEPVHDDADRGRAARRPPRDLPPAVRRLVGVGGPGRAPRAQGRLLARPAQPLPPPLRRDARPPELRQHDRRVHPRPLRHGGGAGEGGGGGRGRARPRREGAPRRRARVHRRVQGQLPDRRQRDGPRAPGLRRVAPRPLRRHRRRAPLHAARFPRQLRLRRPRREPLGAAPREDGGERGRLLGDEQREADALAADLARGEVQGEAGDRHVLRADGRHVGGRVRVLRDARAGPRRARLRRRQRRPRRGVARRRVAAARREPAAHRRPGGPGRAGRRARARRRLRRLRGAGRPRSRRRSGRRRDGP